VGKPRKVEVRDAKVVEVAEALSESCHLDHHSLSCAKRSIQHGIGESQIDSAMVE
jgi:hypothetical protein